MIVAIDPGRTTALVARDGDRLAGTALLEGLDLTGPDLARSIDAVVLAAGDLIQTHRAGLLAVEGAVAPTPYNRGKVRITDPAPIIGTAHLVGALVAVGAIIIAPGGHGDKIPAGTPPKAAREILHKLYPPDLIGPRETTGRGKSPRQHLRAAWDVAYVAQVHARSRKIT